VIVKDNVPIFIHWVGFEINPSSHFKRRRAPIISKRNPKKIISDLIPKAVGPTGEATPENKSPFDQKQSSFGNPGRSQDGAVLENGRYGQNNCEQRNESCGKDRKFIVVGFDKISDTSDEDRTKRGAFIVGTIIFYLLFAGLYALLMYWAGRQP
jgi:hypothetical protein